MDPPSAPDSGDGAADGLRAGESRAALGKVAIDGAEAGPVGEARAEVGMAVGGGAELDDAASSRAEMGRLRWRCRRGMRELDELLTRYVDEHYVTASAARQAAFRELLDSHDPLIYEYFLGRRTPADPVLSSLIGRITTGVDND